MDFVTTKDNLLKELELMQGIVEKKTTIPILSNIVIDARKEGLEFLLNQVVDRLPLPAGMRRKGVPEVDVMDRPAPDLELHRRLGVAGGVLAFAMTVAAMAMTVDLARRSAGAPNDIGLAFTIVPFFTVIVFPVLVGIALLYRRQPEIHKRLILIATLELVTAGVARIPGAGSMPVFFVLTDVGLVAILLYDVVTRGRPHAATVWGGLFLIATQFIRTTAGATATWIAFARFLAQ